MAPSDIAVNLEKLLQAVHRQGDLLGTLLDGNKTQPGARSTPRSKEQDRLASTPELAELLESLREQGERLKNLTTQIGTLLAHESELRGLLLEAHSQLLRRDLEFERQMAAFQHARGSDSSGNGKPQGVTPPGKRRYLSYRHVLSQVKEVVDAIVPPGSVVIVVSKGDNELIRLEGRTGWHFPQTADGVYAGHHPANSAAALKHLSALRARGGGFFLFPSTAFWWLDYYKDFTHHLDTHFLRLHRDEYCLLYDLSLPASEPK